MYGIGKTGNLHYQRAEGLRSPKTEAERFGRDYAHTTDSECSSPEL